MPSRLSRYAEGILEACWLLAVVLAPLFFNVYSSRIFEPDKIALVRSLALLCLAAWLLRGLEEGRLLQPPLGSQATSWRERWRALWRTPLLGWAFALAMVYLLATLFSITPRTSWWGSYQRLQGTYTTFSYLILFASLVANLRRKEQVERLVSAAIVTSLPVGLYGVLQRVHADPIPWGADVSTRIAANMGNSIFLAAYLIMVFPLTVMRLVVAFEALLDSAEPRLLVHSLRLSAYGFLAALQGIALYFSGSRGPWLGWAASLVVLWLGISLLWRRRWLTLGGVALALAGGLFLVLLNLPQGPLESLRSRPEFARLGQLLDAESRTGRVRTLIWGGAVELILPHAPLEYPDGRKDPFNALRPLLGYGPESMYVAYNRFYPPELTQVEKRNASPDRAHNETWDALIITGLPGLIVYLGLFGSALYYGLRWLGLIPTASQRRLFLILYLGGGLGTAAFFWAWKGVAFMGVALPFGMVFGVMLYLVIAALRLPLGEEVKGEGRRRAYLLLALTAALVAHYIEINFGIAIAATRTLFWVYAALLLLVGEVLPRAGLYGEASMEAERNSPSPSDSGQEGKVPAAPARGSRRKPRRTASMAAPFTLPSLWHRSLFNAALLALLLATLAYAFLTNANRQSEPWALLVHSLFRPPVAAGGARYGVLALFVTTWLLGGFLISAEEHLTAVSAKAGRLSPGRSVLAVELSLTLGMALAIAFAFGGAHAAALAAINRSVADSLPLLLEQVRRSEGLLARYYLYLAGLLFGLALLAPASWPAARTRRAAAPLFAALLLGLALFAAVTTNLRVIQADMAHKAAEAFSRPGSWSVAVHVYERARRLAPNEDYYYLFLGRAYLEHAKGLDDPGEREQWIALAAQDLEKAQRLNPLNTDHTANLARLYNLWASFTDDPALQQARARQADDYFARALSLSPNNARLWDEWGAHIMNEMDDPPRALACLERALALDPSYDWTYALLGEYYGRLVSTRPGQSDDERRQALLQAATYYRKALDLADPSQAQLYFGYLLAYGGVLAQLERTAEAIQAYESALQTLPESPNRWRIEAILAQLYAHLGDTQSALRYALSALEQAPPDQRAAVEELVIRYGGQP